MVKYVDIEERQSNHVLLMGEPGSGKSTLASKLALNHKLLWISIDNGHGILKKLPREAKENIEIIILPDTPDFPVAIQTLRKITDGEEYFVCDQHGQVACGNCKKAEASFTRVCLNELSLDTIVVIDHLTRLADSACNFVVKRETGKLKQAGKWTDTDGYKLDFGDWDNANWLLNIVGTNIEVANWNSVTLAHIIEGEREQDKKILPKVTTRNFSNRAAGWFDHNIHAAVRNKEHKFGSSTTYDMNVLTKSRTDIEIEKMAVPSLLPFFDGTIPAPKSDKPTAAKVLTTVGTAAKPAGALGLSGALAQLKGK
jgi:hypothetical protein